MGITCRASGEKIPTAGLPVRGGYRKGPRTRATEIPGRNIIRNENRFIT
jgi:hypothetical protein